MANIVRKMWRVNCRKFCLHDPFVEHLIFICALREEWLVCKTLDYQAQLCNATPLPPFYLADFEAFQRQFPDSATGSFNSSIKVPPAPIVAAMVPFTGTA